MTDQPDDLLPCPFCQAAPVLLCVIDVTNNYDREYVVRCDECGAEQSDDYKFHAILAWNRRAS